MTKATPLTEKDTVVLADFDQQDGRHRLRRTRSSRRWPSISEQSPFLNILSDRKVEETLQLMGRAPRMRALLATLRKELCIRTGSKAVSAADRFRTLGGQYVIGLDAVACSSGDTLAKEQEEAATKQEVLKALGKCRIQPASKLGESLATIQKFDVPVEATTPSLEALKAFSMGITTFRAKGNAEAIPFYQTRDRTRSEFAMAYASLGRVRNLGQASLAADNIKKAYALRDRVSEREKYRISALYYQNVTGELEQATQVYELWAKSYPQDTVPPGNLGVIYGESRTVREGLMTQAQETAAYNGSDAGGYSNLADSYLILNRLDDAQKTIEGGSTAQSRRRLFASGNLSIGFPQKRRSRNGAAASLGGR
jgi:tetratricopeptide (TPR) repeat protein